VRAALSRAVPLVAVLAVAAPVAQARAAELGERTLERGDRGDDVRQLQELLTKLDLETDADGVFGAGTVTHVKAYERREDLPVDGRVSPGQVHGMERRAGQAAPKPVASDDPPGADTPVPQAAAGRYIVLHASASGEDYVYMHMSTVAVSVGDSVSAGGNVGEVGQTGDATACHLHFEEWTAPGWYAGGHAKDPLSLLRSLDA